MNILDHRLGLLIISLFLVTGLLMSQSVPEPYKSLLDGDPVMAITEGAVFQPQDSHSWIMMGVGTCAIRKGDPDDLMRCLRVAEAKALRALTKQVHGATVESMTAVATKMNVTTKDENDKVELNSDLLERIRLKAEGFLTGLSLVGSWKSADGRLFGVVMGTIVPFENVPGTTVEGG